MPSVTPRDYRTPIPRPAHMGRSGPRAAEQMQTPSADMILLNAFREDAEHMAPKSLNESDCITRLAESPRFPLGELLAVDVPRLPGVYALWHAGELLYVGIAVTDPSETTNPRAAGVQGRLRTYLDARLTSDFTLAIALRFVVARFSPSQLDAMSNGTIQTVDVHRIVKKWVATNIEFTTAITDAATARTTEKSVRRDGLPKWGLPTFNRFVR
jgi:hypothetical protein